MRKFSASLALVLMLALEIPCAQAGVGEQSGAQPPVFLYFFWGKGCPHCEHEKKYLRELQNQHSGLVIRDFEVWNNKQNAAFLASLLHARGMKTTGVPVTILGQHVFFGFTAQTKEGIANAVKACGDSPCPDPGERTAAPSSRSGEAGDSLDVPFLGRIDLRSLSLPLLTLVIAGMDSFNPCAFFVLLTLLGLMAHAGSRNRMLLVGGIFVFFSGLIYFLFMAAWLNLFLIMGRVAVITTIAGAVSILIATVNIKDFFLFKQGLSLSIPERAKPKLFDRMRRLMRSSSMISILAGTTVLAVVANTYELLCTAGFPMVFTRILTLQALSLPAYYLYLAFYNIVYVIPLLVIVLVFTATLGRKKLTEWQGRLLKLISGLMMLGLGAVLLIKPALLNNLLFSLVLMVGALGLSAAVAITAKKRLLNDRQ